MFGMNTSMDESSEYDELFSTGGDLDEEPEAPAEEAEDDDLFADDGDDDDDLFADDGDDDDDSLLMTKKRPLRRLKKHPSNPKKNILWLRKRTSPMTTMTMTTSMPCLPKVMR